MKKIASADGVLIAYDQDGTGSPLVLVHGMTGNRSSFALIGPGLHGELTVVPMDRRGRGDSGDHQAYAIEREFEDVLAVVNTFDKPALVFGHSFGGVCALGAAMQSERLAGLILYEPWIGFANEVLFSPAQLEQFDKLLAADDREAIIETLLVDIVGIPPHEVAEVMASPVGCERLAAAHTVPREARAVQTYRLPGDCGRHATWKTVL